MKLIDSEMQSLIKKENAKIMTLESRVLIMISIRPKKELTNSLNWLIQKNLNLEEPMKHLMAQLQNLEEPRMNTQD